MADPNHVRLLKDGAFIWNAFRRATRKSIPDLSGADLRGVDLRGADLSRANLAAARLDRANMIGTDLAGSILIGAELLGADMRRADLAEADLSRAKVTNADFREASMIEARLIDVDVTHANLEGADLRDAVFEDTMDLAIEAVSDAVAKTDEVVVLCDVPSESLEASGRVLHALWDFMGLAGFTSPADFSRPRERLRAVFSPEEGADVANLRSSCEQLEGLLASGRATRTVLSRKNPLALASAIQGVESISLVMGDFLVVKVSVLGDSHVRSGFLEPELRKEIDANPEILGDPATLLRRFARQRPLLRQTADSASIGGQTSAAGGEG